MESKENEKMTKTRKIVKKIGKKGPKKGTKNKGKSKKGEEN